MKGHMPLWLLAATGFACGTAVGFINPFTRVYLASGDGAMTHSLVVMARDGAVLSAVFVAVGLLIRLVTKGMTP